MVPYIDLHCDTLYEAWCKKQSSIMDFPTAMVDGNRLVQGGCMAQFFAIFMLQPEDCAVYGQVSDDEYMENLVKIFENSRKKGLYFAKNLSEIQPNSLSGLLTLEDGRAVDGKMGNLERFYDMGIRLITLTWNYPNCFGFPNSFDRNEMAKGLTDFGKDAVVRMQELGMLVDVSHLSDGGFWDVAELCKKPFVASHSNCRSLSPHARNMTDEMIKTLADHGGVMGLNFCPEFLTADIKNKQSRIGDMILQLKHMVNVGGEDIAAIGTDLDGIDGDLEIGRAEQMPRLFEALDRAGFSESLIEKIAWKNAWRVLEVLA